MFLTVQHPYLTSDGPVEAANGVVLSLKEGDEVQLPLPAALDGSWYHVRVVRFAGEPGADPLSAHQAPVLDDVARFGGVPAGRWTFWIDLGSESRSIPLVLRDVEVGAGVTRLPIHRFECGSTLRLRLSVLPEGAFQSASAESLAQPHFFRSGRARGGDSLLEISGLPAGAYKVSCSLFGDEKPRSLEVDGHTDVEWSLDAH